MTLPLVLIHGFTGTPTSWDGAARSLAARPFHLSPLGHGRPSNEDSGVNSWDGEVERLARRLPAGSVHLAGYSLGARLALGVALAFSERIARLTLISSHTGLASETERSERRAADAQWCALLESQGIRAFVQAWEAQPLFATQARLSSDVLAARRAERLSHSPAGLVRSLRVTGLGEMPDYAPRLSALTMPVTLLCGELDPKFLALGRASSDRLPAGRLVLAPNAGHDLLLERPDLVALVLNEETQKP